DPGRLRRRGHHSDDPGHARRPGTGRGQPDRATRAGPGRLQPGRAGHAYLPARLLLDTADRRPDRLRAVPAPGPQPPGSPASQPGAHLTGDISLRPPIEAIRTKMLSLPGVVCDGGELAGSFVTYRANAHRKAIRQLAELRARLDSAEDAFSVVPASATRLPGRLVPPLDDEP